MSGRSDGLFFFSRQFFSRQFFSRQFFSRQLFSHQLFSHQFFSRQQQLLRVSVSASSLVFGV
jgi:hypothetical protein